MLKAIHAQKDLEAARNKANEVAAELIESFKTNQSS